VSKTKPKSGNNVTLSFYMYVYTVDK